MDRPIPFLWIRFLIELYFKPYLCCYWASPVAQRLKRLPAMRETPVRSLGQEDPLEKEMATHSSILAWRIPWRKDCLGTVHGVVKSRTWLSDFTSLVAITVVHTQSCLTLRNSMSCSLPGSSFHGVFLARILEQVAISSSKGSFRPWDQTCVFCIGRQILYHWATWEVLNHTFSLPQNSYKWTSSWLDWLIFASHPS